MDETALTLAVSAFALLAVAALVFALIAQRLAASRRLVEVAVVSGSAVGTRLPLARGGLSIGRDPTNQLVLGDPSVSRRHAEVVEEHGAILLRDLGSTHGTYVGGVRIAEPIALNPGLQFSIGGNVLVLLNAGDPVPKPATPPSAQRSTRPLESRPYPPPSSSSKSESRSEAKPRSTAQRCAAPAPRSSSNA